MTVSLETRLTVPATVVSESINGEAIVLELSSGTYFGLNPSGTRMWQLIGLHGCLRTVWDMLQEEFDVDPTRLADDLLRLTTTLRAQGLLQDA